MSLRNLIDRRDVLRTSAALLGVLSLALTVQAFAGKSMMVGEGVPIDVTLAPASAGQTSIGSVELDEYDENLTIELTYTNEHLLASFPTEVVVVSGTSATFAVRTKANVQGIVVVTATANNHSEDGTLIINP